MASGGKVEIHRILGWITQLHRSSKARPGMARWLHLDDARQHLSHRRGSCAGPGRRLCARFAANPELRPRGQFEKSRRSDNIRYSRQLAISQLAPGGNKGLILPIYNDIMTISLFECGMWCLISCGNSGNSDALTRWLGKSDLTTTKRGLLFLTCIIRRTEVRTSSKGCRSGKVETRITAAKSRIWQEARTWGQSDDRRSRLYRLRSTSA